MRTGPTLDKATKKQRNDHGSTCTDGSTVPSNISKTRRGEREGRQGKGREGKGKRNGTARETHVRTSDVSSDVYSAKQLCLKAAYSVFHVRKKRRIECEQKVACLIQREVHAKTTRLRSTEPFSEPADVTRGKRTTLGLHGKWCTVQEARSFFPVTGE